VSRRKVHAFPVYLAGRGSKVMRVSEIPYSDRMLRPCVGRIYSVCNDRDLCDCFAGFGLAFGSFLNVCATRWPEEESAAKAARIAATAAAPCMVGKHTLQAAATRALPAARRGWLAVSAGGTGPWARFGRFPLGTPSLRPPISARGLSRTTRPPSWQPESPPSPFCGFWWHCRDGRGNLWLPDRLTIPGVALGLHWPSRAEGSVRRWPSRRLHEWQHYVALWEFYWFIGAVASADDLAISLTSCDPLAADRMSRRSKLRFAEATAPITNRTPKRYIMLPFVEAAAEGHRRTEPSAREGQCKSQRNSRYVSRSGSHKFFRVHHGQCHQNPQKGDAGDSGCQDGGRVVRESPVLRSGASRKVCQVENAQSAPTASSASGYRQPIHALQVRQCPRNAASLPGVCFPTMPGCGRSCGNASGLWQRSLLRAIVWRKRSKNSRTPAQNPAKTVT